MVSRLNLRPTPLSPEIVFDSGSGMRKIVFQVIQYKPFQILVESFVAERVATSPSVFHFRIRTSFQVPGFEWVHELLLLCLTSNSAQFCAEIACGKTGLGHNCTDSRFRMKNDVSVSLGCRLAHLLGTQCRILRMREDSCISLAQAPSRA